MSDENRLRKKILVTGAAGFIGSHLCERLLNDGHEVAGIDNYYTGSAENLTALRNRRGFTFTEHDVAAPYWCQADQIYNMACAASPKHYQSEPVATMKTSFLGGLHALEIAKACRGRILQASTSEIYGDPLEHPQTETYWGNVNPYGARACYDEGKRSVEALFYSYRQQHGVDTRIARIFNTYGPRTHPDDGRVVSNFIVQALTGQPITIYGDGSQTRSFCYVDDLVEGLVRLMNSSRAVSETPLNLGNPTEFQVIELAEMVLELTGTTSKIVFKDLPVDDPKLRQPDVTRAGDYLNWHPSVPLREGLERTIAYFENYLASNVARTKGQAPVHPVGYAVADASV